MRRPLRHLLATTLTLLTSAQAAPAAEASAAEPPDSAVIDQYLEEQQRIMGIPGMALVIVKGDRVVHQRGYGRADSTGRPMTVETPMLIASISKPIAATAVMQLVEQGKLDLDALVVKYIPWFRLAGPTGSWITVRQLLHQTSGIPRHAGYPPLYDQRMKTLEDEVRDLARFPGNKVNEEFVYSNANFAVLGHLVEVASGMSYAEYVRSHIIDPLQMTHTYFTEAEAKAAGMAQGHTTIFGYPVPINPPFQEHAAPHYHVVSSAEDLAKFAVPFLNGGRSGDFQLLSPESVSAMMQRSPQSEWYGLGWWLDRFYGIPGSVRHGGDAFGFRHELMLRVQEGWAVVLMTNQNATLTTSEPIGELGWGVTAMLLGRTPYRPAGAYWRNNRRVMAVAIILLLSLVLLLLFMRLWRNRFLVGDMGLLTAVVLPAGLAFVVGGAVLVAGPRVYQHANWIMALWNQPDLAITGLFWGSALVLAALHHTASLWLRVTQAPGG